MNDSLGTSWNGSLDGAARWENLSAEELVLRTLGPPRGELHKILPLTLVYALIFLTGVVGNVCTCIVIARNKYMQTATNYYLFNLAVADLLVLVLGLPLETYTFWVAYPWALGEPFCVLRVMAAETSTYASILTITAFTVERYVAICHPMRSATMSSLARAVKVVVGTWVASAVCSVPTVLQFGLVFLHDSKGNPIPLSTTCNIKPGRQSQYIFEVSTFLFFFAPMTVITVLYAFIGLAIRRSTLSRTGSDSSTHSSAQTGAAHHAQAQQRARRAVLKMLGEPPQQKTSTWVYCRTHPHATPRPTLKASTLQALRTLVAVVVAFFICWMPFHTQRLVSMYISQDQWTEGLRVFQYVLYYISGILYYVSSTINPILYNIMSLKFRQAFRNTIFRSCRKRRRRATLGTYKFYNRQANTDTHLTLINGQSPLANKYPRPRRGMSNCNYTAANKSNSSSVSGSSAVHMMREDPSDGLELDRMVLTDSKSLTLHPSPSPPTSLNCRPYHSYA